MIDTQKFYDYLKAKQMDFFAGVPDSLLKNLATCIDNNSDSKHNIITANEGNAIGIAAGYYMSSGKFPICYMQNSGIGNTVNPLLSLVDEDVYNIPMMLIIGWRGEPGIKDEPQHKKQGKVTLSLLEAMGIKYCILEENFESQIDECYEYMRTTNNPVALVVRKGTFSDVEGVKEISPYQLTREETLDCILNELNDNDFIVSTTGKTSREIFELREKKCQSHDNDFLTVGSMGHTASIAFGMSLNTDNDIYCIDGDGSFIMHMGGFGVITQNAGKNFKYILINNGAHESVGGAPTVAFKINIPEILKGFGFKDVYEVYNMDEISECMKKIRSTELAAMIVYTKQGSRKDLGRPTTTPIENKQMLMKKILK